MDVRCDSCNSEYVFDEARIPPAGLPVRCSTCGLVFRVYPPGQELPSSSSQADWMVRQTNGSVFTFRELTTLQRWIVERKVARGDEISKTGKQWKRLGDIAELATFFQVVEAAPVPGLPQPGTMPPAAGQPVAPEPMPGPTTQHPHTHPPAAAHAPVHPPVAAHTPAPYATGPLPGAGSPLHTPVPQAAAQTPMPRAAWEGSEQQLPDSQDGSWNLDSDPDYDSTLDDDDLEFKRGGAGKWVAFLLLLLLGGGAGTLYLLRPDLVERFIGSRVDPATVAQMELGYQQLARDSYAALDQALATFDEVAKSAPDYPDAHAAIAEAEMARAEYLREEAELIVAALPQLPEDQREARQVESKNMLLEATQRATRAFGSAKQALTAAPTNLAGNRAMADYFRVMQAPDEMQTRIEAARQVAPTDARLELLIGLSLAADASEAAIPHFEKALAAAPNLQRARYKLANVYFAAGDRDKAATYLERLLREVPDHERALALRERLAPEPEPKPEPEPEAEPAKTKVTFDGLMTQADRLRDSDRPGQALKLYERAGNLADDEPDVYLGMGWCYIDLDQPAAAISTFKTALRYSPRLSDAHMGLGEGYRMRGDNANAIKHYEKYLDIMPSGPEAAVARRMLRLLKTK